MKLWTIWTELSVNDPTAGGSAQFHYWDANLEFLIENPPFAGLYFKKISDTPP